MCFQNVFPIWDAGTVLDRHSPDIFLQGIHSHTHTASIRLWFTGSTAHLLNSNNAFLFERFCTDIIELFAFNSMSSKTFVILWFCPWPFFMSESNRSSGKCQCEHWVMSSTYMHLAISISLAFVLYSSGQRDGQLWQKLPITFNISKSIKYVV